MVREFILIDAIPGRTDGIHDSLREVPEIVASRRLNPKIRNQDLLVAVEADTPDDVQKILSEAVRGLAGVGSVTTVTDEVLEQEPTLQAQIEALDAEVPEA